MKKEVCLICIVCFFLGYFIADVVSKCGFGKEHYSGQHTYLMGTPIQDKLLRTNKNNEDDTE